MFSKAVTLSGNNLPVFPIKRPAFYKSMQCLDMIWTQKILLNCTWKVNTNQISQHKWYYENHFNNAKLSKTQTGSILFPHRHFPIQEDTITDGVVPMFFKLRTWHNCFLLKLRATTKYLKGPYQFQADVLLKVEHVLEGSRKEIFSLDTGEGFRCPLNSCPATGYPTATNFH